MVCGTWTSGRNNEWAEHGQVGGTRTSGQNTDKWAGHGQVGGTMSGQNTDKWAEQ